MKAAILAGGFPSRVAQALSIWDALAPDSGLSQQELGQRSFHARTWIVL